MAIQTPIPPNPIGENFAWRDWLQKLSDRVFGTASTLDVPIEPEFGGTGLTTYNTGDIIYSNATNNLTRLPPPASTSLLQMTAAGVPSWTASGSGTVTSVAATAGTGISITGSPITTLGTLNITNTAPDQTVALTQGGTTTITGTYPNFTISSADQFQGTVTSVTGTSPVVSSGGATPAISLASGYGDTQNPYASKTANFVLGAPNGVSGVPTFRAVVAADIPTLNQSTTGSAATLTTGRTLAITGDLAYTSPSFDGSTNVTAAGTLATVNTNVGSFTNATLTVNGKGLITAASSGTAAVTSVTATSPVLSSGGATPDISIPAATTSVNGYLTSTDWTTFNNKGSGTVTSVGGTGTVNGITLTGTVTSSGNLTLGGTLDLSSPPIIGGTAPNTGNFSTVNLSAGTTTVAPLDFATGTNLTTPAAGAWEYDGTAFYATPIASNRAVNVAEHFVARTGTKTMTSNTALQSIFDNTTGTGGLTSGALTVGASTSYFFEMSINVSGMSATSGNMGFSIVGAGTATFTSAAWHAFGLDSTNQQTAAAGGTSWRATVGATGNIVTAATGTAASAIVKGIFRINGAGTIIPSIQLTTASAAVIGVNTWFKCYPVGTDTVISVGNWA